MKNKIVFILFLLLTVISCNKVNEISVSDIEKSECKTDKDVIIEKINFKYINDNTVTVTHSDVFFNCCVEEIKINTDIGENTITIKENEKGALCNCVCPYDVNFNMNGLETKDYTFIFEKYDNIFFEIKLNIHSQLDTTITIREEDYKRYNF